MWSRGRTAKDHACSIGLGSNSMLPRRDNELAIVRTFKKMLLISQHHPHSQQDFCSFPTMVAERQRQLIEGGYLVIHPHSLFKLIWCSFMVFINGAMVALAPFRYAFILPEIPAPYFFIDALLLALKVVCILDMFVKFNTGYRARKELKIVLTRKRIICHYLYTWFTIDLISCFPFCCVIPYFWPNSYKAQMIVHLLPCMRCFRFYTVLADLKIFIKPFITDYLVRRCLRHLTILLFIMHLCTCVVFFPAITFNYWYQTGYANFATFLNSPFENNDIGERYVKGLFVISTTLYGTGYPVFGGRYASEILINCLIVLTCQLFMIYTMAMMLKIYLIAFDSSLRYQELINQVEKYMRLKEFPKQMANRVRDFYEYRYQRRYFLERFVLDCLSEQLRTEIFLDTCHKLIQKVVLFEGLPAGVVGTVLGCLKPEVYMKSDLIIKAGEIGDCMYFIACGTVAVYSLKGAEVCHLEDGEHFGEVALLMKDRKRVATVVAIEITQVYRLDSKDFKDFIMTYHELYQRIEELASKRMHETVLIDEAFKHMRSL